MRTEHVDTVIIGGSQAGLTMGRRLQRCGLPFVILEANERPGDAWRHRWNSLRLFTPRRYSGLEGMRLPGAPHGMPTKDEMADHMDAYAERFDLPLRTKVRVDRLSRQGERYVIETSTGERLEADNVVLATGASQERSIPSFAEQLDPSITQLHSVDYRDPSQLQPGGVLIVGAGNSGADIAIDVAESHQTRLSGRHTGHVPFRIESFKARFLLRLVRFAGQHVLTWRSPIGRKVISKLAGRGRPLVRVKPKDLQAAGVERVPRVTGVQGGRPLLEDGRVLDVPNVIWCTGFRVRLPWIELPLFDESGWIRHVRGISPDHPGLYFVGLEFQFSATSDTLVGIRRDAGYVAKRIAARSRHQAPSRRARVRAA